MDWHPISTPHTQHSAPKYWAGVHHIVTNSNLESPRVSVRRGPADMVPPESQPPITGGARIGANPDTAASWRADEHMGVLDGVTN